MDHFLSCDWGTTSFRLRLVSFPGLTVVAEENSDKGIATVFDSWNKQNEPGEKRFDFYLSLLTDRIKNIREKTQINLDGIPIVVSGMASSTIGMMNIPYKSLPVTTDGSDLITRLVNRTEYFSHDLIIVSGLRSGNDVIRGEETQLVGAAKEYAGGLYIFPGTHSKHVWVKGEKIEKIKTYMTGEFFDLLTTKSILSFSVDATASFGESEKKSFRKGVQDAQTKNLLHGSFLVRTNLLFSMYTKQENFYYLSGLLIGSELKEIFGDDSDIFFVGTEKQCLYYKTAIDTLDPARNVTIITAASATIKGRYKIIKNLLSQENLLG